MPRHPGPFLAALAVVSTACPGPAGPAATAPPAVPAPTPYDHDAGRPRRFGPNEVFELDLPVDDGFTLRLRAITAYRGRTAVLLHGGPGLSHEYVRPLETLASPTLRVATYDQRGAGRSTLPRDAEFTMDAYVADLAAVHDALGSAPLDLVGHSWGGLVALGYAMTFPDRVRSLVLIDAVAPMLTEWNAGRWRLGERAAALKEAGVMSRREPPVVGDDCGPPLVALLPAYYADPRHPATRDLAGSSCSDHVNRRTWDALGVWDYRPELESLAVPVLALQGDASPFGVQMLDATIAALPSARVERVVLPGCGHVPWEECPTPFYEAVERFLAAH